MPEKKPFMSMNMNITVKQFLAALAFFGFVGVSGFTGVRLAVPSNVPTDQTVREIGDSVVVKLDQAIQRAALERSDLRGEIGEIRGEQDELRIQLAVTDSTVRSGIGALEQQGKLILNSLKDSTTNNER